MRVRTRLALVAAGSQLGWIALVLAPAGFFARAADVRVILFAVCAAACAGAEVLAAPADAADPLPAGPGAARDTSLALASGLGLFACFALGLGEAAATPAAFGAWHAFGAALVALGLALRASAIRRLGAAFVSAAEPVRGSALVTSGPYRFVRHPSELGLVAIAAGAALLLASARAGLVTLCVLVPVSLLRCRREERLLERAFGADYAAYRRATGAFARTARRGARAKP